MRLTFLNRTSETLVLTTVLGSTYQLSPSQVTSVSALSALSPSFSLSLDDPSDDKSLSDESEAGIWDVKAATFAIQFSLAMSASWRALNVPKGCPLRVYRMRISRKHHQILIFPQRDLSRFLSELPDTLPLSTVTLPGTHDTMAFYGWPISQCQFPNTPLETQLQDGIRVLDIRLSVIDDRLIAYHGIFPQRAPFMSILATIHAFLTDPRTAREALVVSIKQEDFTTTPGPRFSRLVHDEIIASPGGMEMWFLDNRVPTLGEVRGKVMMFSRFGGDGDGWDGGLEGLGMHPTNWPDSEKRGFTWMCKNTVVMTHDWYAIPSFFSIPEKVALSTQILLPLPEKEPPVPALKIAYFSAASFPLAFPPTVARGFGWPKYGLGVEGVNSRVGRWLLGTLAGESSPSDGPRRHVPFKRRSPSRDCPDLEKGATHAAAGEPRIRGWALMDYYTDPEQDGVVPLLVECNFRGRVPGQEGWV